MAKPREPKVDITWSPSLSYVIGIIASDGNISSNLRHLNITSKDYEMLQNIKNILGLNNKIGVKGTRWRKG